MSSWNWSSDFTLFPDIDMCDPSGVALMFFNAYNERLQPMTNGPFNLYGGTNEPVFTVSSDATLFWRRLRANVQLMGGSFTPTLNPAGISIIESKTIDSSLATKIFPNPNGWHRKLPRTIYTLSQPGSIGQRARFEFTAVSLTYVGVLAADPLFGTNPTTPTIELVNRGLMFDHNGTTWVQSTDQISSADLLLDLPLISPTLAGDYITLQMLNDLRDALNQCTVFIVPGSLTTGYIENISSGSALGAGESIGTSPYTVVCAETGGLNCNPLGQNRDLSYWYHTGGSGGVGGVWNNLAPDQTGISSRTGLNSPSTYTLPGVTHADRVMVLVNWGVTGGFKYVSGYAGV